MTLTLKDIQTFKSVIKNSVSLVIHVLYTCSGYHGRMGKLWNNINEINIYRISNVLFGFVFCFGISV